MTKQYILSSWQRSYLYPLNVDALIYSNHLDQLRPCTPPTMPAKTLEHRTPKKKLEWAPIMKSLHTVVPESHMSMLTKIEHYIDELKATVTTL